MPNAQPTPANFQKATFPTPRLKLLHPESGPAARRMVRVVVLDLTVKGDRTKWEKILNNPHVTVLKDQEHVLKTQILTFVRYVEDIPEPTSAVDELWPT